MKFSELGQTIFEDRYALPEESPVQLVERVATAVTKYDKPHWQSIFQELLASWAFVPGGRILSGAGAPGAKTLYNCYVLPAPHDSRAGIVGETLVQLVEIMSRGGGVGINLSSLRPAGAHVAGVNGASSGSVSWGGGYALYTSLISQGGTRRGALMLVLEDWHPDLLEFIEVKQHNSNFASANLSVGLSDAFMDAVVNGEDWEFIFPDTSHPAYDTQWTGDIQTWQVDYPVISYGRKSARAIWQSITESAWATAGPGVWFTDTVRHASNSWYYAPLVGVNPCGEEPLPAWGVCNLGSLNLTAFFDGKGVDWGRLKQTIHTSIRFLDNIVDITPYYFEENWIQQNRERRIGLGTMGLADLLILLKLRYGSREALDFVGMLYEFIAIEAYKASSNLAKERGSFPKFEAAKFMGGQFPRKLPRYLQDLILEQGLRNATVLTVAPTGTTATMLGVSTGIEPHYSLEYERVTRLGTHVQRVPLAQQWAENHPGKVSPSYFVTAMDISAIEHIQMQAAIQHWIDAAVSKTINLPATATVSDVQYAYMMLHALHCKGGTVYRDGSLEGQVLTQKCADGECAIRS